MTDQHRTALFEACYAAKVFLKAADFEIRGGSPAFREEAANDLQAALRKLSPAAPVPVVDWQEIEKVYP
jgi:hypothetical protein